MASKLAIKYLVQTFSMRNFRTPKMPLIILDGRQPRQIFADRTKTYKQIIFVLRNTTVYYNIYLSSDVEHCNPADGLLINLMDQYILENWKGELWAMLDYGTTAQTFNITNSSD